MGSPIENAERRIFAEALERPSGPERDAYVEQACADHPELFEPVRALLAAHDAAGGFMPAASGPDVASAVTPLSEGPGSVIGRYKLLQKIGEGGFGVVYMAEQREPVKRRVALKIIKLGMDTKQVVGRFEAERQALAMMDHPNIAKVLDAGATETGRPFFVMELVRGIPITQYCDDHQLSPKDRLELFIQVCGAIQHAHQKGIIHRDIKPSNVMITLHDDRAVPKVIDFGIAKATQQELTEKTIFTRYHEFLGTPAYMSPEQAQMSGLDVDTRSDIYSLGVLLYELLTGRTPFDGKELLQAGYDEMRRVITEKEPLRPSTCLNTLAEEDLTRVARRRRLPPEHLRTALRGDLDWVVMKSLEKDRSRRFESASAFAEDIRRYLRNEPVTAVAPSAVYRFRKFAQRHRAALSTVLAFTLLLVVGIMATSALALREGQARRRAEIAERAAQRSRMKEEELRRLADAEAVHARREAALSKAVVDFLNNDLLGQADPFAEPIRDIRLRTVLDRASERVGDRFQNQPLAQAAIRSTLGSIYRNLGEYALAEEHWLSALQMHLEGSSESDPGTIKALVDLGAVKVDQKDLRAADEYLARALALAEDHLGPLHEETIRAGVLLAFSRIQQGRPESAEDLGSRALQAAAAVFGERHKTTIQALNVAGLIRLSRDEFADAERLFRRAIDAANHVFGEGHSRTLYLWNNLANVYYDWRKFEEAEALYTNAWARARSQLGDEHPRALLVQQNLAYLYQKMGRLSEAEDLLVRILRVNPERAGVLPVLSQVASSNHFARLPNLLSSAEFAWRFTTNNPGAEWFTPEFDDRSWEGGQAPFASHGVAGPKTSWDSEDLWVRGTFSLSALPDHWLAATVRHDDDVNLYLNGVEAAQAKGWSGRRYRPLLLSAPAQRSLRLGSNLLAIHCRNHGGEGYLDARLSGYQVMPAPGPPSTGPE